MTFDGRIGTGSWFILYLVVFAIVANWLERRWNPQPPHKRYLRNPNDAPFIAFWNVFSSKKWTDEGLAFHRRRLLAMPIILAALGLGYLLTDWIW
jgi:hypothetical protein